MLKFDTNDLHEHIWLLVFLCNTNNSYPILPDYDTKHSVGETPVMREL